MKRIIVICGVALAVTLLASATVAAAVTTESKRQLPSRDEAVRFMETGPRGPATPSPVLPSAQAAAYKAAWKKMADCLAGRGYPAATEPIPESFGDGRTPMPLLHSGGDGLEKAITACPLPTEQMDRATFEQSLGEATTRLETEQRRAEVDAESTSGPR